MNDVKGLPEDEDPLPNPDTAREMIENGVGDQAMVQVIRMHLSRVVAGLDNLVQEKLLPDTMQKIPIVNEVTPVISEAAAQLRVALRMLRKVEFDD